jgi:outer membrane receptor protein involved in Fe transport
MRAARKLVWFSLSTMAALPAAPAAAAEPHRDIIVTGERVGRTVFDTSSSVAVLDSADLEVLSGADRLDQILSGIPNLQLGSGGEGPTIRGQDTTGVLRDLPAFLGGTRPRVTLQIDGRPISYNELAFGVSGLWDIERIEVFRSPQTTTQGRNSIAGAIFIETKDPSLDWQGRVRLTTGNYDTRQVSVALSGPLVPDQLAFRLAGDIRRGRTTSEITSPARGIDPDRDEYELLRLKLLATPAALPGLRLLGSYVHTRSQSPQIEGIKQPYRARRDPTASYGIFLTKIDALTLRADTPLTGRLTAKATGWLGYATIRRFAPPGFGEAYNKTSDAGGEFTLTWTPSPDLSLVGGVAAQRNALDQAIDLTAALLGTAEFGDRQHSFGAFGQFDVKLRGWTLTAGLRYQRDMQRRVGLLKFRGSQIPFAFDHTYSSVLPKGSLAYSPAPDLQFGLSAQRAYNPGGTTISLSTFAPDTFESETLWAYEAFARARFAGDALQLSANIFYYDVHDAQRSVIRTLTTPGGIVSFAEIGNTPAAWSRGAELQVLWRPNGSLSITAGLGLQRTKLTHTLSPADPLLGKEFQRAPHLTGSLAIDWRPAAALRVSGQLRHNTGYFSDDANDPLRRVGSATTVDARAEWSRGPLSVVLYARNLFDEFHLTYLFTPSTGQATAGEPRKIGIELSAAF